MNDDSERCLRAIVSGVDGFVNVREIVPGGNSVAPVGGEGESDCCPPSWLPEFRSARFRTLTEGAPAETEGVELVWENSCVWRIHRNGFTPTTTKNNIVQKNQRNLLETIPLCSFPGGLKRHLSMGAAGTKKPKQSLTFRHKNS